jgi:hypothetical protein
VRALAVVLLALLALPAAAAARVGTLDPRFSRDGHVSFSFGADEVVPVAAAPDGAGGTYLLAQGGAGWVVARVTRHGVLRGGFGRGGRVVLRAGDWDGNQRPTALALQTLPGGARRLLAAGQITGDVLAVHALSPTTAAPDPGFGTAGRALVPTRSLALPGSGIALGPDGSMTFAYGRVALLPPAQAGPALAATRLRADGSPDPAFGAGGTVGLGADLPDGYASSVGIARDAAGVVRVTTTRTVPAAHGYVTTRVTQLRLGPAGAVLAPGRVDLTEGGAAGALAALAPGGTLVARGRGNGTELVRVGDDGTTRSTIVGGSRVGLPVSVVADARGRAYVLTRRIALPARASVVRFTAAGRVDRGFGRRGVLTVPLDRGHRLLDGRLALDPRAHRLWIVGDDGDGLSSIRDDFGKDRAYVASVRLR